MAKAKQPAKQLKEEVHEAVQEAKTGNMVVVKEPGIVSINVGLDPDKLHLRDSRSE